MKGLENPRAVTSGPGLDTGVRKGIRKPVEAFLCRTEWQNHGKIESLTQLMMDRWCKCAKDGKKFGSRGLQLSGLQGHVVVDPDIPGHPSSHYLVSESLRVEMLSALVFLKITKINWWFILENRVGSQCTVCWPNRISWGGKLSGDPIFGIINNDFISSLQWMDGCSLAIRTGNVKKNV